MLEYDPALGRGCIVVLRLKVNDIVSVFFVNAHEEHTSSSQDHHPLQQIAPGINTLFGGSWVEVVLMDVKALVSSLGLQEQQQRKDSDQGRIPFPL